MTEPSETTELTPKQKRREIINQIATALNETEKVAISTIARLVYVLGEERALSLLAQTKQVEAEGGLMTSDGQRQRTPGGIFFKLAKDQATPLERGRIFNPAKPKNKGDSQPQLLDWPDILPVITELFSSPMHGEADKMKLTLIGKPGKVMEKGPVVMASMQSGKAPSLPKGLPAPPDEPTTYLVFVAVKQWRKVESALAANPADRLIVEGFPVFDKRIRGGTLCLYAQSVTTTALQRAKWANKPETR